jgi:hypothetical protein
MDDRRHSFLDDDVDEFDLLLEDDDDDFHTAVSSRTGSIPLGSGHTGSIPAVGGGAAARPRPVIKRRGAGPYKPARLRANPNWSRIAAAAFIALVVVTIMWFAVSSYMNSRKQAAYKSYFAGVGDLMAKSDSQGQALQSLLSQNGTDRAQLIGQLQNLGATADTYVSQGRKLNAPSAMTGTNLWLVTTLQYRRDGIVNLRKALMTALGASSDATAADAVVQANDRFIASDVVWSDSYANAARQVLAHQNVGSVTVPPSQFLKDQTVTFATSKDATLMLQRLRSAAPPTVGPDGKLVVKAVHDGKIHGGQLGQVTMDPSGQTLSSTGVTEVSGSDSLAFEVSFENQGQVQETNVPVSVTLTSPNAPDIPLTASIPAVDPGATGSVKVPLSTVPAFGATYKVNITVGPVPGERNVSNNSGTFQLQFKVA